jgi:Spy/CpxP family protein refolding chaperone
MDFSAVVLAAAAASKAFLEASSLASRDDMRALAADKASAAQEGKRKSNKETEKGTRDRQNTGKKVTLRSSSSFQIFDTFSAQRDELTHQDLPRKRHK